MSDLSFLIALLSHLLARELTVNKTAWTADVSSQILNEPLLVDGCDEWVEHKLGP